MLRTLYAAARYETPFSLTVALADTTIDPRTRYVATNAFRPGPQLLQTSPCCLSRFCALTGGVYGTPREVLMERTLYPMYMGCMASPAAAMLEESVFNGCRGRPCGPALPVRMHSANRYGIDCPECSIRNRMLTGRRCSLSFHCIPLQTRCPIHGCRYRLAHPCSALEMSMLMPGDAACVRNTLRTAATLFRFLQASTSRCWLDELELMLGQRGYIAPNGWVRRDALARDFSALYSAGFEDVRLGAWVAYDCIVVHVLKLIRQPERSPHPVEIALLRNALDDIEFAAPPVKATHKPTPATGGRARARRQRARGTRRHRSSSDIHLRAPDYRNHAFLHRKRNAHGHELLSRSSIAPRAKPHGVLVAAFVRMCQWSLADAIQSAVGSRPVLACVIVAVGFTKDLQLPSLRMPPPVDGKLSAFAQALTGTFDTAFPTQYAASRRSALFRGRDIVPATWARHLTTLTCFRGITAGWIPDARTAHAPGVQNHLPKSGADR